MIRIYNAENCPKCGVSLQGPPIPEKYQNCYGGETHYSRKIGIYDRDLDRTVAWTCPECLAEWPAI